MTTSQKIDGEILSFNDEDTWTVLQRYYNLAKAKGDEYLQSFYHQCMQKELVQVNSCPGHPPLDYDPQIAKRHYCDQAAKEAMQGAVIPTPEEGLRQRPTDTDDVAKWASAAAAASLGGVVVGYGAVHAGEAIKQRTGSRLVGVAAAAGVGLAGIAAVGTVIGAAGGGAVIGAGVGLITGGGAIIGAAIRFTQGQGCQTKRTVSDVELSGIVEPLLEACVENQIANHPSGVSHHTVNGSQANIHTGKSAQTPRTTAV